MKVMTMEKLTTQVNALVKDWKAHGTLGERYFASGEHDSLTDVAGVSVGHLTLDDEECQTGVTVIQPSAHNIYARPLACGQAVLNGFSKPTGLTQLAELGELETPITLTNTLSVGRAFTGVFQHMIATNPEIGRSLPTVNPVVLECNDGFLNDIQAGHITEQHVVNTLNTTTSDFARGSVGAGRGMSCFGLKGGIGSASCYVESLDATVGVLVLANFGVLNALQIAGVAVGQYLEHQLSSNPEQVDKGSIIIVMATDAPLNARQLNRLAKRAGAGLGRLGSYWGHGSGDIAVAFSTCPETPILPDDQLDPLLRAAAEGTEYAVIDALLQATDVTGFAGHTRRSLSTVFNQLS